MRRRRLPRRGRTPVRAASAFDVRAELMFADRKPESRLDGDMTRLILFAEYGF